jgi:Archaeal holliday junction resolvase (hjc)
MTPEAKVKKKAKMVLDNLGAYHFSPMTGGYGNSGVPDIVACYEGFFIAVECKAQKGKPTLLQLDNLKRIDASGGFSVVVNEDSVEFLEEWIQSWVNTVGIRT